MRCLHPHRWRDDRGRDVLAAWQLLRRRVTILFAGSGAAAAPALFMLQAAHPTSRHHMLRRSTAAASLIGVLVALCAAPAPLHAHGMPAALEFWGAFGRRGAPLQRLLSPNAARVRGQ